MGTAVSGVLRGIEEGVYIQRTNCMTTTIIRVIMTVAAGVLIARGASAQIDIPFNDTASESAQPQVVAVSGAPSDATGTTAPTLAATAPSPRKHSALLARERSALGVVTDAVLEFYPSDEFLRLLPSGGRPQIVAAPYRLKMKAATPRTSLPGVPSATSSRLYQTDSSLASLTAWYASEYGLDFVITNAPLSEAPERVLTVARAVKRFENTLVTVMIWNPSSVAKGRKGKQVSLSEKTSVEVLERSYRPRGELIVEGPDAVVELTWKVPYYDLIQQVSVKYQLDPHLLAALVQQESNFNAGAISVDSAQGLTQMIPGTAEMLGVTDPHDPRQSVDAGARYLKMLLKRFRGNVEFALAGYNAGPGNVEKYKGIPPFQETRDYVRRIMARYREKAGGQFAATAQIVIKI